MRFVHPAAWVGLLINLALAVLLYNGLEVMDLSGFEPEDREAWTAFIGFMLGTIRPFHYAMLLGQAAALLLIVLRAPFALPLALFTAALTIPGSFIYVIGALLTYYRFKYAGFASAPLSHPEGGRRFRSASLRKMYIFSTINGAASIILLVMGDLNFSVTFFGLVLVGLYCARRANKNSPLCLYRDSFTVSPGVLTPILHIPYADVETATLRDDKCIEFEIHPGGNLAFGEQRQEAAAQRLVWSVLTVEPEQRRQAVEELGAALEAHSVPLR